MTSLERLRLSTALAHTVPGAALHLRCRSGQELTVSCHPSADLDPCAMRKVVIASACADVPDYSQQVVGITVTGSLEHIGGGVHRRAVGRVEQCVVEQRWMATLLQPDIVASLLDECRVGDLPVGAMHGCVRPDGDLAVTCVAITSNGAEYDRFLDEVAAQAMSTFMVEELLHAATQEAPARRDEGAER